jgi:hypothetical protein
MAEESKILRPNDGKNIIGSIEKQLDRTRSIDEMDREIKTKKKEK